jgi:hypothetical protein
MRLIIWLSFFPYAQKLKLPKNVCWDKHSSLFYAQNDEENAASNRHCKMSFTGFTNNRTKIS